MCANDVKLSKMLSWLLRHGAVNEGLEFDEGGFIDINKILKLKQFRNVTSYDIQRVVEANDKKRFSIRGKNVDGNVLQIRANQGHSIKIEEDGLLTFLTGTQVPLCLYHGTYFRHLESIKVEGLNRMNRNHIHFTSKLPGQAGVISGMRKNCEIFIVVDSMKANTDGFKFYKSENEVILCSGNENGRLPANYIKEIWQVNPLRKLC